MTGRRQVIVFRLNLTAVMIVLVASLAAPSFGGVTVFEDKGEWIAAVGDFTTVDFTGFPFGTSITDQYADQGVVFGGDVNTIFGVNCSFATDRWGLDGNAFVTLTFARPQHWIAADFPGGLAFQLFSSGALVFESDGDCCGHGRFEGLVSTEPFDSAVVLNPFGVPQVNPDNVHFGPAAPVAVTPVPDCNDSGFDDLCDIDCGWSLDCNGNQVPDECDDPPACPGDVAGGDCRVDLDDLTLVIMKWGDAGPEADANADGIVDVLDLIIVLINWGTCGP